MSDPIPIDEVVAAVRQAGLVAAGETVAVEPLGGGVSNDVFAVRAGDRALVLKRALPRLRVAAEWRSDVTRIHREAACQRWLGQVLRPGEVPAVLAEDHRAHLYLMERAPASCRNWKDELLAGRVAPEAAAWAGDLLGRIHAAGRRDAVTRQAFADQRVFDQLRLDPYLRTTAGRHPDLAEPILELVDRLATTRETVVHGDFSPKNLLLAEHHLVLLDHEVAHTGDPRFDLGFFFSHLVLKALHVTAAAERLWAQLPTAWEAYGAAYPAVAEADWMRHLGCLLLARVDGKSPAEYLTPAVQERVRALARPLIRGEVEGLAGVARRAREV